MSTRQFNSQLCVLYRSMAHIARKAAQTSGRLTQLPSCACCSCVLSLHSLVALLESFREKEEERAQGVSGGKKYVESGMI